MLFLLRRSSSRSPVETGKMLFWKNLSELGLHMNNSNEKNPIFKILLEKTFFKK